MILRLFTRGLLRNNRVRNSRSVDQVVCIDIESTCDSPTQIYPMEMIEIACLKMDLEKLQNLNKKLTVGDDYAGGNIRSESHSMTTQIRNYGLEENCPTFHSFVKPVINPELTLFCQDLTGITQNMVDKAPNVEQVLDSLFVWLKKEDLIDADDSMTGKFSFCSCGNFDLNLISPLVKKCRYADTNDLPVYFKEWINVKKTFIQHKDIWPKGLYHMLEILEQKPIGRLHSAIDDCKNLANIVGGLHIDGCQFRITNKLPKL